MSGGDIMLVNSMVFEQNVDFLYFYSSYSVHVIELTFSQPVKKRKKVVTQNVSLGYVLGTFLVCSSSEISASKLKLL